MSTILDALRKVEENQRTRSADARAQLLSFPSRPSAYSSRQQRTPWIIGAGLALAGFAAGVGLMFWGPSSHAPEESQMASATRADVPSEKGSKPSVQAPAQSTPQPPVQASPQLPTQALPQVTAEPAPIPAQVEAGLVPQVPMPQSPPFTPPPTESAPPEVPPVSQMVTPTLPSSLPSPSAPAQMPAISPPPAPAVTPPAVRSAQAAPIPQLFNPEERRAAHREALRARQAARHGDTSLSELRELATAAKAARTQPPPLPEPRQSAQPEARAARTATPNTKSSTAASTAVTIPPNTSLSFLQWSPEPDRRLASIKINGGPLTLAHEGDTVEGYTIVEIRRDAVELSAKGRSFTLQVEE